MSPAGPCGERGSLVGGGPDGGMGRGDKMMLWKIGQPRRHGPRRLGRSGSFLGSISAVYYQMCATRGDWRSLRRIM